ncbi:Uncharacterised protein [Plesiomonas shigelloides]|nr:Uncharacterised protein [Plesiomonas shigelloides]
MQAVQYLERAAFTRLFQEPILKEITQGIMRGAGR